MVIVEGHAPDGRSVTVVRYAYLDRAQFAALVALLPLYGGRYKVWAKGLVFRQPEQAARFVAAWEQQYAGSR